MASTQTPGLVRWDLVSGTKRKRICTGTDEDFLGDSLTIRGHSLSTDDKGITIDPRLLTSRSNLPLSFLAPHIGDESIPRIFRGDVGPLEPTGQELHGQAPSVLIATRSCPRQTLYAIERVSKGIYALCELADWVRLEDFEERIRLSKKARSQGGGNNYSHADASQSITFPPSQREPIISTGHGRIHSQKVRLLMKPPYKNACTVFETPITTSPDQSTTPAQPPETELVRPVTPSQMDSMPIASLDEVLEKLKRQYLETLYNSKASLAYFAKGPLTRPRGLLLQEDVSRPSSPKVCEALRSCILSRSMLDTKYSKSLSDLVKDLPLDIASDDNFEDHAQLQTKVRKPKKRKKLGKNGMFPEEEEYVRKWYIRSAREEADDNGSLSREERKRIAIASQRSRETQIQITLMLEVIALEMLPQEATSTVSHVLSETAGQDEPVAKSKKAQNLPELVDVLVEKLCIWQSTDLDLSEGLEAKASSKELTELDQQIFATSKSNNSLEGFCTQIIIPFYAARLPDLSASICRKLGVSIGLSPKRPAMARTLSKTKPNHAEPLRDKQPKRQRTLARVLTDDKLTRQGSGASLVRSNTDSAIPRMKREASEISLSEVPASKGIKAMPRQYSQREVDLAAVSRNAEARLQRKQLIEQEKNAAIALLKKPNARLAVMDLLESKDQRETGAKARSRKSKNPVRNLFAQGVQVTATPQTNRHKDVFQPLPRLKPTRREPLPEPEAIPPSSDPRVPSSSRKADVGGVSGPQETPVKGQARVNALRFPLQGMANAGFLAPPCHDTPAKRPSTLGVPRVPLSVVKENVGPGMGCAETPSRAQGGKKAASTLSKAASIRTGLSTPAKTIAGKTVAATPLSNRASREAGASTPSKGQKSIYESLGWDIDDVDDLV